MATTNDFVALMQKFDLEIRDKLTPGRAGIIDIPTPDVFFTGRDARGRVFANLPIIIKYEDGSQEYETIVIYQRYANRDDMFALSSTVACLSPYSLLGTQCNNLQNVEKLLSGRKISLNASYFDIATGFRDGVIEVRLDLPSLFGVLKSVFRETFAAR